MQKIRTLIAKTGNPLDWSSASKASLLLAVCVIMHSQYIAWAYFQLSPFATENNAYYVNIPFIENQLSQYWYFFPISISLFVTVFLLRKRFADQEIFEHIGAQYYGVTLSYCSYLIGNLSMATGVVIAGAPIVGLILFNRRAVFLAFAVSLSAQAYISYACLQGTLTHAPVINNLLAPNGNVSSFWVINLYLFTLPHLIIITTAAYFTLRRWRRREAEIHALSLTDPLTQLSNRRCILSTLSKEVARSCRHAPPLSIILVDLDHFKQINDTQGHPAGDEVLRVAAQVLKESIRQSDHVGRYGGEEFLIILPETDSASAEQLAERCRINLADAEIAMGKRPALKITGSFGLFCNENSHCDSPETMLHLADEALYQAKSEGRNKVVVHP